MKKLMLLLLPIILVLNIGSLLAFNNDPNGLERPRFYGFSSVQRLIEDFPVPENVIQAFQRLEKNLSEFQQAVEKQPQNIKETIEQVGAFFKLFIQLLVGLADFILSIIKDIISFVTYVITWLPTIIT